MNYQFVIYKDAKGEWRWKLRASNGRTVADSGEGYKNRTHCEKMCQQLSQIKPHAPLVFGSRQALTAYDQKNKK